MPAANISHLPANEAAGTILGNHVTPDVPAYRRLVKLLSQRGIAMLHMLKNMPKQGFIVQVCVEYQGYE
ncbi:hypothetical protein H2202_001797 [Exophiala xenobiotica]|nr:hypothetical protein H2202_001797 [Exophiala xenobiotica]